MLGRSSALPRRAVVGLDDMITDSWPWTMDTVAINNRPPGQHTADGEVDSSRRSWQEWGTVTVAVPSRRTQKAENDHATDSPATIPAHTDTFKHSLLTVAAAARNLFTSCSSVHHMQSGFCEVK